MFRKIHVYFVIIISFVFLFSFVDSTLRVHLLPKTKITKRDNKNESHLVVISSELKQNLDELSKQASDKKSDQYEYIIQSYARHLESDEIDQLTEIVLSKNAPLNLRQLSKEILDRNQSDYAEKKRAEININQGLE